MGDDTRRMQTNHYFMPNDSDPLAQRCQNCGAKDYDVVNGTVSTECKFFTAKLGEPTCPSSPIGKHERHMGQTRCKHCGQPAGEVESVEALRQQTSEEIHEQVNQRQRMAYGSPQTPRAPPAASVMMALEACSDLLLSPALKEGDTPYPVLNLMAAALAQVGIMVVDIRRDQSDPDATTAGEDRILAHLAQVDRKLVAVPPGYTPSILPDRIEEMHAMLSNLTGKLDVLMNPVMVVHDEVSDYGQLDLKLAGMEARNLHEQLGKLKEGEIRAKLVEGNSPSPDTFTCTYVMPDQTWSGGVMGPMTQAQAMAVDDPCTVCENCGSQRRTHTEVKMVMGEGFTISNALLCSVKTFRLPEPKKGA